MPKFPRAAVPALGLALAVAAGAELLPRVEYVPAPGAISVDGDAVTFHADGYDYVSLDDGGTWEAVAHRETVALQPLFLGRRVHEDTNRVQTIFQSELGRDAARLLVRRFDGLRVEPLADLDLYDRWMVREAIGRGRGRRLLITPDDTLPSAPHPAAALFGEPRLAGQSLWFGVGWQAGATRGVGALVRHELDTRQTRIYRPYALENRQPMRLTLTPDAVWIAVGDTVGGRLLCRGLVRFDPRLEDSEEVPVRLENETDEIRVLEAFGDTIWLATRGALYRTTDDATSWTQWRLRATAHVDRREEVSNTPGIASRRAIPSGNYFVVGVTRDSILVRTNDGIEGWIPPDSLIAESVSLREAPDFAAVSLGRFPDGDAIERLPMRTPDGWTKARARVGWLFRRDRMPTPVVAPPVEVPRSTE